MPGRLRKQRSPPPLRLTAVSGLAALPIAVAAELLAPKFNGLGHLLGDLAEAISSFACGVSADGSVDWVVGQVLPYAGEVVAFIWDEANGRPSLQAVLIDDHGLGQALAGQALIRASPVSADGLTFVGDGINPLGYPEAWVANVPEPQTWAMLAARLGVLGWVARRRLR